MLARSSEHIPTGDDGTWLYEPKWDGFRALAWRDDEDVEITSRGTRGLTRYFPEMVAAFRERLPARCVVDGELVVADEHGLNFDTLGARIHPAASRVERLAAETPAAYIAFDLLALGDEDLTGHPFAERRARLTELLGTAGAPVHVTPATTDVALATEWFEHFEGAGLDGVVAKRLDDPYRSGERALTKIKHQRSADCVVAGYRVHRDGQSVGSLLLGLYDQRGVLHAVGVTSGFTAARRRALVDEVEPLRAGAAEDHPWIRPPSDLDLAAGQRRPGGESRWNAGRDSSWEPLRIERVAEVGFSQLQGDPAGRWGPSARFRHPATFQRWRPDREPGSCTYAQLEVVVPVELAQVLASGSPSS